MQEIINVIFENDELVFSTIDDPREVIIWKSNDKIMFQWYFSVECHDIFFEEVGSTRDELYKIGLHWDNMYNDSCAKLVNVMGSHPYLMIFCTESDNNRELYTVKYDLVDEIISTFRNVKEQWNL